MGHFCAANYVPGLLGASGEKKFLFPKKYFSKMQKKKNFFQKKFFVQQFFFFQKNSFLNFFRTITIFLIFSEPYLYFQKHIFFRYLIFQLIS